MHSCVCALTCVEAKDRTVCQGGGMCAQAIVMGVCAHFQVKGCACILLR